MKIKKIRGNEAVSEIIGTVLLLVIAIIIFSSLIIYVLSSTDNAPSSPDAHLMGSMDETQHIIIEHRGGETPQLEDLKILIWKGQEESYTVYLTHSGTPVNEDEEAYTEITFHNLNDNAEWDLGDYIDINCTGLFSEITYWQISVIMIDKPSNSIIMSGILQQGILHPCPPIAIFTYAPLDPKVEEIIEFNASQSYDPDGGTLVIYKWDFDDDGTIDAYGKVVVHQYTSAGTYMVTLTVVDDEGQEGVATTGQGIPGGDTYIPPPPNVTENQVPIVNFSWYVDPDIDGTIHFSADVTDPDGEIASFEWHFGDGNSSSSQNPSHTYSQGGNYTVTLIVYDDDGGYNSTEITITVPNILPIAGFSYNPANVTTASTVNFDGDSPYSFDKDGSIVNWTWDFDNNSIIDAYGATTSNLFSTQGVYTVVLNVTDNDGDCDLEIKNITVYSPATAAAPKFLLVDNTPTDSPPGVWESGIDNIIAACQNIMPDSDYSYGRAIDQWTFTNDSYTSSDLRGENITDTVLNDFDIVIWSTGDFMGDGGGASYDGNANTWSTSMTEGSDDTSNHVYEIYEHLTGNQTAGTFLLCGAYAVRDLQDYPGNGANDDEIWLGETLGLIEPTGGIEYDSASVPYSGRCGGGSFQGKPYDAAGSLIGIINTSSAEDGIVTLNFTSLTLYELYKRSNETFAYSLQASGEVANVTLLYEDMETNPGWSTGGTGDEWHWGICAGGPGSAHSGSRCYGTDMQGANYNYNNYADCYVRTGYIDLTDSTSAYLEFYDWYQTENGFDYVYLEVEDGPSWDEIANFTGNQLSWTHKSYNISSYIGDTIRIRWRLDSDSSERYDGYYLDDVWVNGTQTSPPPGYYAIDALRETNRSIVLGFDLNADEITNESRENYLRSALAWLAAGAGYYTEIWVNNDPPGGWLDEPDHVDTIQGGIGAVVPGGTVYVNGTTGQVYTENVVVDKSINLIGIDNPTIRASGTNVVEVQVDWAKIDGFTIEGNSVQNGIYIDSTARCTVINCTISTNISKMGVYLSYSHNNTIQDNTIHDCLLYGIYASWSFGNKIKNNDIYSNSGGIYLYHSSLNSVTNNNNIYDNGNKGGVYIESGEENTMVNNSIFNNTGDGISLYSSSNENEIEKNTLQNNSHGVSIEISSSNIILNNTISSNRDSGVYIEMYSHSNTIRENSISSNVYAIELQNSSNNGILLNTIENNQYGAYLFSSGSNVFQTNDICNNTNDGMSLLSSSNNNIISSSTIQNNSYGIYVGSSSNNVIQENNISSNTLDGVYLYLSLTTLSGENNITNNTISLNSRYGIYLYKSMGNVISNNSIYLNVQDGIRFYFDTDENSITNNTIWNNSYGIYLYKSSYNVISSNIIHNNSIEGIHLTSYSTENTLYENTIENNTNGIKLESSSANNITTNTIRFNQAKGTLMSSAAGNAIYSNQIYSNTGDGVYLQSSDDITITKNTLWSNLNGVHLLSSGGTGNTIVNNTVYSNTNHGIYLENSKAATAGNNDIIENEVYSNNDCGIYLYSSNINSIQQNEMYSNNDCGIFLSASDSNTLQQNEIYSNDEHGISLYLSDSNDIQSNNISFNQKNGIYILQSSQGDSFPLQNNLIWNNSEAGVYLNASSSNYVTSNTIWNNSYGVVMKSSSSNVVRYSILRNNSYGLYVADSSTTNEIRDNNMTGNNYGVYITMSDCTSNEIYNNNFINNTLHDDSQAYDNGTTNSWHFGEEGNYWSNYRNPYTVPPNGQDNYPLGSPKQWWL